MLKKILSYFGIVGYATAEQSLESQNKMVAVADTCMESTDGYSPIYGYHFKDGLTSTTVYNYAILYNSASRTVAIISANYEKMEGELLYLCQSSSGDKLSFRTGFLEIVPAEEGKKLRITIPYKNKANADTLYLLPIDQVVKVENFSQFLKTKY